jgi:hypothetical protein
VLPVEPAKRLGWRQNAPHNRLNSGKRTQWLPDSVNIAEQKQNVSLLRGSHQMLFSNAKQIGFAPSAKH